jgi:molybdenum cofactor cytidylyltransferase
MIAGLIPAAGHSRRMGRPKLALPLGGRMLLEHVIEVLKQGGVEPVLVVLGPHAAKLSEPARAAGAEALILDQPTPDMRATIEHGLDWLTTRCQPSADDAWLLVPADHPTLDPAIVRRLIAAWRTTDASILVPTWQGRRGHPTLIGWSHLAGIKAHPAGEGLNAYLRRHQHETLELPADNACVIEDVDTPEDYERLLRSLKS